LLRIAAHRASRAGALLACAAAALTLAGCGNDNDPGPGGVTVGEARALDEAAEMLEQQRLPAKATPTPTPTASPAVEPSAAAPAE
jgi:hypothetical protein